MTANVFDFALLGKEQRYKLLIGIVVPRPIALVTTIDEHGRVNAAPFSFFNVFSDDPPQIILGLQHKKPGSPKDTTRNLSRAREFVVNMVDEPLAEAMNLCAIGFPPEVSEIEALGLPVEPGIKVAVPRLASAPFALECRKSVSLAFTESREILIGEVLGIYRPARTDRHGHPQDRPARLPPDRAAGGPRLLQARRGLRNASADLCRMGRRKTVIRATPRMISRNDCRSAKIARRWQSLACWHRSGLG